MGMSMEDAVTSKKYGVGDNVWIADVINRLEGINIISLDPKEMENLLVGAFVEALPQIVSHQEIIEHIRGVAENVIREQLPAREKSDVQEIAQRM